MTKVEEIYQEEKAKGFSPMAPLRLTAAVLHDASENHGIQAQTVATVKEVITFIDGKMREHPKADTEEVRQYQRLNGPLLAILDKLVGPNPESAWSDFAALGILARGKLLEVADTGL
jgi:hypothetical protein